MRKLETNFSLYLLNYNICSKKFLLPKISISSVPNGDHSIQGSHKKLPLEFRDLPPFYALQANLQSPLIHCHSNPFENFLNNLLIICALKEKVLMSSAPSSRQFSFIHVRGKCFHTKSRDDAREVQNSGLRIVAETMHFASAKDRNLVLGNMTYYGVIEEIWELNYFAFRIALFKCSWVDNNIGVKNDELSFTLVDLSNRGSKNDPFIMASQVVQVFYISNLANDEWSVFLLTPEKRFLENEEDEENADLCYDDFIVGQPIHEQVMGIDRNFDEDDAKYIRNDINDGIVDMANSGSESDSDPETECPRPMPTRGATQMNKISKLMDQGKRVALKVNDKGQYCGKSFSKLVSTLGVRYRQTIGLSYKNWKEVNSTLKNKVWTYI
ncbi:hypothetical protein CsatB_009426 [Cannabis sativa]